MVSSQGRDQRGRVNDDIVGPRASSVNEALGEPAPATMMMTRITNGSILIHKSVSGTPCRPGGIYIDGSVENDMNPRVGEFLYNENRWQEELRKLRQVAKECLMNRKLNVLWTNADVITFEKMVYMYTKNSLLKKWWDEVVLIIWGGTAKLVGNSDDVKKKIKELMEVGVKVSACKACADQLGVTGELEKLGIEVKYWGEPLTAILQNDEKLLSI